jgi:hypothetical protein
MRAQTLKAPEPPGAFAWVCVTPVPSATVYCLLALRRAPV